uniref:Putative HNH homing endonuclease n=1 Tax=Xylochloris irregularis TaxID=480381 RepID=A0A097KMH1_9CHLO|nr:putative HNH homing endonuclease [Xylochloris irregularis]AIT94377.1 putative HNH homing endonuclease [Xylochloris irregularis]
MPTTNAYDQFIKLLKQKAKVGFDKDVLLQKHHILPLHAGGLVSGETVLCSIEDHAKAHLIRYEVYSQVQDKIAALFIGC